MHMFSNTRIRNYIIDTFSHDPGVHGRGRSSVSVHNYSKTGSIFESRSIRKPQLQLYLHCLDELILPNILFITKIIFKY